MTTVLDALAAEPANQRDTIVLFLSDHGALLGSHGGMFQKWYTAYEEAIRVPFVVHSPTLFNTAVNLDIMTSHADILPTMLGLAGLDADAICEELSRTHNEAQPLVGRDLSGVIFGEVDPSTISDPVYFMTDDDVGRGSNQNNWMGMPYQSVVQPNNLETVIAIAAHRSRRGAPEVEVLPLLRQRPVLVLAGECAAAGRGHRHERPAEPGRYEDGHHDGQDHSRGRPDRGLQLG